MSLDAKNALGNDWRGLAEEMGMNLLEVNYIESKNSPTLILLDKWKAESGTLAKLQDMFKNMHREDLVELLHPLLF